MNMRNFASPPQNSPAVFVTDHLALASYLLSRQYVPTLSLTGSGKVLFRFDASENLAGAIDAFNNRHAAVEPTAYDAARIRLRRQIDALLGGGQ